MYEPPPPVVLTAGERRALRIIEDAFRAEDPGLSGLLDGAAERHRARRLVRTFVGCYVVLSLMLLVFGLAAANLAMLSLGLVLLLITPAVRGWATEARRWWPI